MMSEEIIHSSSHCHPQEGIVRLYTYACLSSVGDGNSNTILCSVS